MRFPIKFALGCILTTLVISTGQATPADVLCTGHSDGKKIEAFLAYEVDGQTAASFIEFYVDGELIVEFEDGTVTDRMVSIGKRKPPITNWQQESKNEEGEIKLRYPQRSAQGTAPEVYLTVIIPSHQVSISNLKVACK